LIERVARLDGDSRFLVGDTPTGWVQPKVGDHHLRAEVDEATGDGRADPHRVVGARDDGNCTFQWCGLR
jgi:hypothetical protein